MAGKEKKSKKNKKYVAPQEPEEENNTPVQETNETQVDGQGGQVQGGPAQEDFDPAIRMRFSFINSIYQILLLANSRVNWDPEELVPVGMVLRDLKTINVQMLNAIQARRKETEEQKNEENGTDENSESSSTA